MVITFWLIVAYSLGWFNGKFGDYTIPEIIAHFKGRD